MVIAAHVNMGPTGDPQSTSTDLIKERLIRMFTNGPAEGGNIPAALCHHGQSKEGEMKEWGSLVEADIRSIAVNASRKEVRIELAYAGGDVTGAIAATGVDDCVVYEMRISNVVDRVQVFGIDDAADPAVIEGLFFLMRGRLPDLAERDWPPLREKLNAMRSGALTLVDITPVYGARVLLLAQSIELLPA